MFYSHKQIQHLIKRSIQLGMVFRIEKVTVDDLATAVEQVEHAYATINSHRLSTWQWGTKKRAIEVEATEQRAIELE